MTPTDRNPNPQFREEPVPSTSSEECVGLQLEVPIAIDVWKEAERWDALARFSGDGTL